MTRFYSTNTWLRDYYYCELCYSIPRQRHIMAVLDGLFPAWTTMNIHESSPSADFLSRYCPSYSSSYYLPNILAGTSSEGMRCESIEALTFEDGTFDLFVTQDVLEHVFHPDRALREIMRVLKPGGAHVFTAPKHKTLLTTMQRAAMDDEGNVTYLLEAQYHGSPVGDGRSLVTWDYGYDFEQLMSAWTGASVEAIHTLDRNRGLDADFNEVFIIRKPVPPSQLGSTGTRLSA